MPVDRKKIDYDKLHEQYIVQGELPLPKGRGFLIH